MKSTIDRKKRSDLTFPLKPKRFLNIFKSEPMREKPGIMEYNKFIIVTKGVDIKTLLSGVSDLNRRENIEYFFSAKYNHDLPDSRRRSNQFLCKRLGIFS